MSGAVTDVKPINGVNFTLDELQTFVNGGIEIVQLNNSDVMVINEDHRKTGAPVNGAATYLYGKWTGCPDRIHGDVLICKETELGEDRTGDLRQLRLDYERIAERYTDALNKSFGLDPDEGWWVGDYIGSMYCNGDLFSVTFDNMILIVDLGISKEEYLDWVEYCSWAHEFGQTEPNLKSWHAGCPRHASQTIKRLTDLKQELITAINELKL